MPAEKKPKAAAKKILVSIIVGFVAVAFVGSFAYRYISREGSDASLAVINGEPVSVESDSLFANIYRQYFEEEKQKGEEGISDDKNRELLRRALDTVIQRTLILQYAEREGIRVSRDAVLSRIVEKGYYAGEGKKFDERRFNETPQYIRDRIFKAEKEQLIIAMFVDDFITTPKVSDIEVELFYRFVDFGKKIDYVYIRYDDVPEEQLRSFYNENPRLFEQTHAAHILIKDDEQRANDLYLQLSENPDLFEEIAREESEDATAEEGGDLGWFYRKDMVAEFSETAFSLQVGEISAPVKTVFGYHIIKALDDPKIQPYDEALSRIKREYVAEFREEIEKETSEKSRNILEQITRNQESFGEVTREAGLQTQRTDYISVDGQYIMNEERTFPLFEIMNLPSLIELVMNTDTGKTGGPVKSSEGEIIFRVIEEKEFDRSEFEKSHDYIVQTYTNLKGNFLFNDWYMSALRNSKIVDNFNSFFKESS
jgi:parvulin-like peptidyl-prolyl isomerase